jgi:hypothetical protein
VQSAGTKNRKARFLATSMPAGWTPDCQAEWKIMLGTVLLIILILLLLGALPNWGYSRSWGYGPSGGLGLVVLIIIILLLMGRI